MRRRHASARIFGEEQLNNALKVGLVGHWLGGLGSGSGWRDRSGYQNHGVFVGAPKWTLGGPLVDRPAVQTAAGTDQVNCGSNTIVDDLGPLSVSAWVLTTDLTNEQAIVEKLASDATAGWGFVIAAGGAIEFFNLNNGGGASYVSTPTLSTGRWYHVACTLTAQTAGTGLLYVNGSNAALTTNSAGGPASNSDAAANLSIAGRTFDTAGLIGIIDDVRLYNRVLSAAEIAILANPSLQVVVPNGRRSVSSRLPTPTIVRQAVHRAASW